MVFFVAFKETNLFFFLCILLNVKGNIGGVIYEN